MTKPRKPLDDALAQQFVYGQTENSISSIDPVSAPSISPAPKSSPGVRETGLMTKILETEPKEATVRLTVDLTETMHRKLSLLSARTGRKKAAIVRMLLEEALEDVSD